MFNYGTTVTLRLIPVFIDKPPIVILQNYQLYSIDLSKA